MKITKLLLLALSLALPLLIRTPAGAAAVPTVTQAVDLNPGWNAVYLEVTPPEKAPAVVFRGLPTGASVWAWTGKSDPVQFIQDPGETPVSNPRWLAIFAAAAESGLNNLYAITANNAYLIHLPAGTPPLTLNIAGRPTIRHREWIPDSFNLTGFGFTATPPTFAAFFAPSAAHKNQAIYRLNNVSGSWEPVTNPTTAAMRSGEAFWIYCQSGSDYQGPLAAETDNADGLDFGIGITLLTVTVANASSSDRTVALTQLGAANPVALAYRRYDATSGQILTEPLTVIAPITVKAGNSATVTLAAQRGSFSGTAASVLEFSDAQGSRIRLPVTATSNPVNGYPGLWTGSAALNMVSQLTDSGPAPDFANGEAKATPAALNLNLILHQDRYGQVRLLKQAILMHQDGTLNADGSPATAGRYVALTDDALLAGYSGVTERDGAKVGRRLSAVGIDYSPGTETDFDGTALKCSGSISTTVSCRMIVESSAAYTQPTNPFLHRYHPDHDNLASDFATFRQEANRITRDVTLVFDGTPRDNPGNPPPGWGVTVLGGTYTEHIRGLAKGPIKVQGNFTIKLASDVDVLNQ